MHKTVKLYKIGKNGVARRHSPVDITVLPNFNMIMNYYMPRMADRQWNAIENGTLKPFASDCGICSDSAIFPDRCSFVENHVWTNDRIRANPDIFFRNDSGGMNKGGRCYVRNKTALRRIEVCVLN
ncbi:hypothetical protein SDC9_193392 [bioreactor metagenome]|uniref:Uncharacterized protein n=1 Tax=bioreactor metagenome TaxID=1076179 RepID=A0A645I3X6_9ZZZZ